MTPANEPVLYANDAVTAHRGPDGEVVVVRRGRQPRHRLRLLGVAFVGLVVLPALELVGRLRRRP